MIIKLLTEKDTYVTNLNTKHTEGIKASLGNAATLDIFKIYNENKYSKSKAIFDFNDNTINNNSTATFIDSKGTTLILSFNNQINFEDSAYNNDESEYIIGIANKSNSDYPKIISDSINKISLQNKIRVDSFYSEKTLVLIQQDKGELGDTKFYIDDISNVVTPKVENNNYFARIDWSAVLIKFKTSELKDIWAVNGLTGAFSNYKSEIILKDVSTGQAKPKEYSLSCYTLKKSFLEGLGKDTINFSDSDTANFTNLNRTDVWAIPGFVSKISDVVEDEIDRFYIANGEEDIKLDITSYTNNIITDPDFNDFGILITLSDEYLYDTKSYFVKRAGSRHLLNKNLVPSLNVIIDDSQYNIDHSEFDNVEHKISDNTFNFYLVNDKNNIYNPFILPTGYDQISHKIVNNKGDSIIEIQNADNISDFIGNNILGIKTKGIDILGTEFLNPENFELAQSTGKLTFKSQWYYTDSNAIKSDLLIESKDIEITYYNKDSKNNLENLYVTIKFDKDLTANNSDYKMSVYLIDLKEKVSASKKPYNLKSKNIGNIFYKIIDKDTVKTLVDIDSSTSKNGTKLKYNGTCYTGKVFISELFKNKNLNIELHNLDDIGNTKILKNNNISFKVT